MTKPTEPTEFDHFRELAKQVLSVPKAEIDRRQAAYLKGHKGDQKGLKIRTLELTGVVF